MSVRRLIAIVLWPFYLAPRLFVRMFTRSLGVARPPGPMHKPETRRKRVLQVMVAIGIIVVAGFVVLFSQTRPAELGTTNFVTDRRPLPAFTHLFVSDDQWVEITVDPDAERQVAIFMDGNLVQFVLTDVVDGTLRIETSKEMNQSLGSIIRIVANALEGLTVEDGSIVEVFGVNTPDFTVDARDGSLVEVAGEASSVDVRADKSRVTTRFLAAEVATVAITGDSIIDVFASVSIDGSAGDGTEVRISGSPGEIRIDADDGALVCRSSLPLDVPFTCIR